MSADGNWNISIETPIGTRAASLSLSNADGVLTGTQAAEGRSAQISNGKIDGDKLSWSVSISEPMPMTLAFEGKVEGDRISGHANAGVFGSMPFSGTRA